MKEQNGGRIPYKKGLMKIVDQLDNESAASRPEKENDPSQTGRDERIAQIHDQLLLLEGYAAVRWVAVVMWMLVIFQVLFSLLKGLQFIKPAPFIDDCMVWLPVIACLGVVLISVFLLARGIPFKPVRQCVIIALALLANAALNYYHDYLKEFMRLIVGWQFGGK